MYTYEMFQTSYQKFAEIKKNIHMIVSSNTCTSCVMT